MPIFQVFEWFTDGDHYSFVHGVPRLLAGVVRIEEALNSSIEVGAERQLELGLLLGRRQA